MPRLFLKLALAGKIKKKLSSRTRRRTRFPVHADSGEVHIVPQAELNDSQRATSEAEQVPVAAEQFPVAEEGDFAASQESIEGIRSQQQILQLRGNAELKYLGNLEIQVSNLMEEISIILEAQIVYLADRARYAGSSRGKQKQSLKDTLEGFANVFVNEILPD